MSKLLNEKDLTGNTEKAIPVSADKIVIADSEDSDALKTIQVGNLPTAGGGNVSTSGTPVDNDFAKFVDGTDIEGRSYAEVRTDLNVADGATANSADATLLARANHTGTQTASTISDFDTEVSNNSSVTANTAKVTYPGSADATELNILDGATLTTTELNYVVGVTSAIQTQLGARVEVAGDTMTGALVAADHGTAATDQVVNICYGTSETPPTASTTTEGALYVQYTA